MNTVEVFMLFPGFQSQHTSCQDDLRTSLTCVISQKPDNKGCGEGVQHQHLKGEVILIHTQLSCSL